MNCLRAGTLLGLCAMMSGCTAMNVSVLSGASPKNGTAIGVAKGVSQANYFFGVRSGNDTANAAVDDALKGTTADDIQNLVVDHQCDCVLFIICHATTIVRGTLIKYSLENGAQLENKELNVPAPKQWVPIDAHPH